MTYWPVLLKCTEFGVGVGGKMGPLSPGQKLEEQKETETIFVGNRGIDTIGVLMRAVRCH